MKTENVWKQTKKMILALLFPKKCFGCEKPGISLCDDCFREIYRYSESNDIVSICDYKNKIIKKALWSIKYHGNKSLAREFGTYLYDALLDTVSEKRIFSGNLQKDPILLLPIPLSKKRQKERGYNQSEEIARGILAMDQGNAFVLDTKMLRKIRETKPQALTKNKKERVGNLKDAFTFDSNTKNVQAAVLIDDITTTGTTFNEVRDVLQRAGVKQVFCFAIAH